MEENFPKIISVDDHVIEPANVWQDRLPEKYKEVGPRVVRERGNMQFVGGVFSYEPDPDGAEADWWVYEDLKVPQTRLSAAVGFDRETALKNLREAAPGALLVETSARTGEGMAPWYAHLEACVRRKKAAAPK